MTTGIVTTDSSPRGLLPHSLLTRWSPRTKGAPKPDKTKTFGWKKRKFGGQFQANQEKIPARPTLKCPEISHFVAVFQGVCSPNPWPDDWDGRL